MNRETKTTTPPLALTIFVDATKSIDDVVCIARVEGRKKLGCNVKIIDVARKSEGKYQVWVLPKYQSLDVGALYGMRSE